MNNHLSYKYEIHEYEESEDEHEFTFSFIAYSPINRQAQLNNNLNEHDEEEEEEEEEVGAWRWASERECACAAASEMGPVALAIGHEVATEAGDHGEHQEWDTEWDAGDLACGDLVLELRQRLAAMQPGAVVRVVARDPGAPADLPAWCGMTGHRLVFARHPEYGIERRRS